LYAAGAVPARGKKKYKKKKKKKRKRKSVQLELAFYLRFKNTATEK
jgi:hypothetical protein